MTRIALIQLTSTPDQQTNLNRLRHQITEAVDNGARMVATPETTNLMTDDPALLALVPDEASDPIVHAYAEIARSCKLWLLIGSIITRAPSGRLHNRSLLFNPRGNVTARYDKCHLFDVTVNDQESYRESARYDAGSRLVTAATPAGQLGLSICYDLRFPYLYRALALDGADLLAVPAAFTRPTGAAHWEILLRARAIECGAYVLAPAQCGIHYPGRETWGHSMIIDPWGEVIAKAGRDPAILYADIDPSAVQAARRKLPSLVHGRNDLVF